MEDEKFYVNEFVVEHRLKALVRDNEHEITLIQSRIDAANKLLEKLPDLVVSGAGNFTLNTYGYCVELEYDPFPRRKV